MFKAFRNIYLSFLTVTLLIGGFSKNADANTSGNNNGFINIGVPQGRNLQNIGKANLSSLIGLRGGNSTVGHVDSIDFDYSFSIFDTTSDELNLKVQCDEQDFSCVFQDAISDLEILLRRTDVDINRIRIGTDSNLGDKSIDMIEPIENKKSSLFKSGESPNIPSLSLPLDSSEPFSPLNLRTKKEDNKILYHFTDFRDNSNGIQLELFEYSKRGDFSLFGTQSLGFEIVPDDKAKDINPVLAANLVADPRFILDIISVVAEAEAAQRSSSNVFTVKSFDDLLSINLLDDTRFDIRSFDPVSNNRVEEP